MKILQCLEKKHWVSRLDNMGGGYVFEAIPLTIEHRPQVEAYLNERGWKKKRGHLFENIHNINQLRKPADTWMLRCPDWIGTSNFDTAPTMQAEAILMARLLNATKT